MDDLISSGVLGYVALYTRLIAGTILLVAGVVKAKGIPDFAVTIQEFRLLPIRFTKGAASLIVTAELLIGWMLLMGLFTQLAAIGGALLFSVFAIAIRVNLARHNIVRCNCFGPYFGGRISLRAIVRNLLLISLCSFTALLFDGAFALDSAFGIKSPAHDYSFTLAVLPPGAFVFALLIIATAKRLFTPPPHKA